MPIKYKEPLDIKFDLESFLSKFNWEYTKTIIELLILNLTTIGSAEEFIEDYAESRKENGLPARKSRIRRHIKFLMRIGFVSEACGALVVNTKFVPLDQRSFLSK